MRRFCLSALKNSSIHLESVESSRLDYTAQSLLILRADVLGSLLRYEAHLSREFDRTLNQLERIRRLRRGQPVASRIDVNVSTGA